MQAFGDRLKEAREQLHLKQKEFSSFLDVTASSVSGLEKGKSKPSYDVLKQIYSKFNISINYLLDGHGDAIINRELGPTPTLDPDESTPEDERLKELLYYIENAPIVKYAVFEFFSSYLFNNKVLVNEDMKKHLQYLRRLKQAKEKKQKHAPPSVS